MATGYPYQKVPLDKDKNEIRVLRFAGTKGLRHGPLKFSFKTISLNADPQPAYYAVSYTWGSPDIRRELFVDGHRVSVPHNTEEALRSLCRHKQKKKTGIRRIFPSSEDEIVLWIDAICINQVDVNERNWQVAMMGLVFSTATEVLIWLGRGGDGEHASVAIVQKLTEHCRHETDEFEDLYDLMWTPGNAAGHSMRQYGDIFRSASLPGLEAQHPQDRRLPISKTEMESLNRFFSAPWFTRMWAVQEVLLAKKPVCYFGEHSIPAWDVLRAAIWADHGRIRYHMENQDLSPIRGLSCAIMIYYMSERTHLWEILQYVRNFDCADLRDKLYAVIHLTPLDVREKLGRYTSIDPDYSNSLDKVWSAGTKAAILEGSDIRLLRRAGMYKWRSDDRESFPSWVPDYDKVPSPGTFHATHYYKWYQGTLEIDQGLEDRDVLSIKGTILGQVTQVGMKYGGPGWWSETRDHLHRELASIWQSVQSYSALQPGESLASAVATVFTCGMRHMWTSTDEQEFNVSVDILLQSLEENSTVRQDVASEAVTEQGMPFLRAFHRFSEYRVLFIAESGRIGMAPAGTKPGDTIVQLFGCHIPFILRQEGEYWRLLGDAYFHNLPDHIHDLQELGQYPNPRFFKIR